MQHAYRSVYQNAWKSAPGLRLANMDSLHDRHAKANRVLTAVWSLNGRLVHYTQNILRSLPAKKSFDLRKSPKQNIALNITTHWSWAEFTAKLAARLSRLLRGGSKRPRLLAESRGLLHAVPPLGLVESIVLAYRHESDWYWAREHTQPQIKAKINKLTDEL